MPNDSCGRMGCSPQGNSHQTELVKLQEIYNAVVENSSFIKAEDDKEE